jgi:predicted phage terminase large subunit-like protein
MARPARAAAPAQTPEDFEAIARTIGDPDKLLIEIDRALLPKRFDLFVKDAWHVVEPGTDLVWNWHLDTLCGYIQAFFTGRITRLILNVPPGSMKSLLLAVMGPAWAWTFRPEERIVSLTNELGLATRDNRRMRQVIESDWYQVRWGDVVKLSHDQSEKTLFANTRHGFRQGLGMGGNITGKRGSKLLIDDPVDAKKAFSDIEIASANQTYDQAVSSRLNSPRTDGICLIMQRLRTNDLTGHLIAKQATKWVVVKIPMEFEGAPGFDPVKDLGPEYAHLADPRTKIGELMFAERFDRAVVRSLKEDLGEYGTAGQLQQRPSPLAGGIIKSAQWRVWPDDKKFPRLLRTFASWDTAFSEKDLEATAYSCCTIWGVWLDERDCGEQYPEGRHKILLLSAWWGRVDWDDLLAKAVEVEARKLKKPADAHLIENKASGQSLITTMRKRTKVRVIGYDPKHDGGGDKVARAYLTQPYFSAGLVYRPNRPWAESVADKVGEFPAGDALSVDLTDTCTQAVNFLVNGWWLTHPDDAREDSPVKRALQGVPFDTGEDEGDDAPARSGGFYG